MYRLCNLCVKISTKNMKKIRENKGRINLLELIIIIFLAIEGIFLGIKGLAWYYEEMTGGNDTFLVNTAYSTGVVNSLNGIQCPVSACGSSGQCTHKLGDDYVGYFDYYTHLIVEYPPEGYNQGKVMRIGDKYYFGNVGTMVIQILCHQDSVECKWVKGK